MVSLVVFFWFILMLASFKTISRFFSRTIESGPCSVTKTCFIIFILLSLVVALSKLELKLAACLLLILVVKGRFSQAHYFRIGVFSWRIVFFLSSVCSDNTHTRHPPSLWLKVTLSSRIQSIRSKGKVANHAFQHCLIFCCLYVPTAALLTH